MLFKDDPEAAKLYQQTEEDLDGMVSILGDLKKMASDMGTELDVQNKNLDTLGDSVDSANTKLASGNKKIVRLHR